jgi:DNA invertase Pin-like site-specific DNA recombinase
MSKTLTREKESLLRAVDVVLQAAEPGQLRAVAYLRVSTEEQRKGYGISYTGKRVAKHITKKGWALVDIFADEGVKGTLDHTQRPGLRELLALARQVPRPFDVVCVYEERAIGRRDKAFWPWVWKLEDDYGIFTAVVKGDYDNTTDEGRSRMRKAADRAEDELVTLRDRTQGGVQEKAEEGGHPGGVPPYGYRIENRGVRGESRLVLDVGEGVEAFPTLHRAYELLVNRGKEPYEVEDLFNAEGHPGPSGRGWPRGSLRYVLTTQAVQESRRVFRNPKGRRTRLNADGTPRFGETVVIKLDPVFSPEQLVRLNVALARTARGSRAEAEAIHPLSEHLISECGAHRTGVSKTGRSQARVYRCTGTRAREGVKCDCAQIDAEAVENKVWSEVCRLLEDPVRLERMAEDWLGMIEGSEVNYETRLKELDEQIEEQEAIIDATSEAAARRAKRKGLDRNATQEAIARATRDLEANLESLESLRDETRAWQKEAEQARTRAQDLQRLAETARTRLHSMDADQQAEVIDLLGLKVTILGPVPRKTRLDDRISNWFRERDRAVPVLTDAAWEKVAPILLGRPGRKLSDPRALLEALLKKARTGCAWADLGHARAQHTYSRWAASGLWEELMEALAEDPGTPPADPITLPPLRIEGRIDPRLFVSDDKSPEADDVLRASRSGTFSFRMELAA